MNQWSYAKTMSRTGLCYFILMLTTQFTQNMAAIFTRQFMGESWYIWTLSYIPLYCIAVPVFYLALRFLLPDCVIAPQHKVSARRMGRYFVLLMGAVYFTNMFTNLIVVLIGWLRGTPIINPLLQAQQNSNVWLTFLCGCIIAPIGEEIIFRKTLYGKIGQYGQRTYVLMGGLLFALFHGNLSQMLYAFVAGALFCYIYAKTGKIIYTIVLHMAVNFIGVMLAPLALDYFVVQIIMGFFVMLMLCISAVVYVRTRHEISYEAGTAPLPPHPVRTALMSPGMVLYMALCGVLIVLVTFPEIVTGGLLS